MYNNTAENIEQGGGGGHGYQFPKHINTKNFFRMDRELIASGAWARLPLASKTIYPTIAVHADSKGRAFPSQETISTLSGCTPKTVREGLKGLLGFPGFNINHWVTRRGKRANKYIVKPAPQLKGASIRIYKAFFEGGNWSQMVGAAHALYPVLLAFSYFDFEVYASIMDDSDEEWDYSTEQSDFFTEGAYEKRKFDLAEPEIDVLAEYAGISVKSVYTALQVLKGNLFIGEANGYWMVFRLPPKVCDRKWLNTSVNFTP